MGLRFFPHAGQGRAGDAVMARGADLLIHTGLTLALALLASSTAFAQANAGGQINDGAFPPGFDCNTLDAPKTRLECQTFQAHRTPPNDVVPPGTPAFPMPGESNSMTGPYIGSNPGPQDFLPGRRPASGH
jgi:hypothetical protein